MSESKAMILGCAGTRLTREEAALYADQRPWGLILFARNIGQAGEIADLTARFRDLVGRPDAPVLIDQEGGRVQRIRAPIAPDYPAGATLGAVYARDGEAGLDAARLMGRLLASDLAPLGINVDCLPVLDVPVPGANDVIGTRAYGHDADSVAAIGGALAEGLIEGGVLPVMKHIPGHGRSMVDSHKALPVVDAPFDDLDGVDFEPFRRLGHLPMAMTAHIVYRAVDADNPATTSARVIGEIIRGRIGFEGLLMSDDLSMHALSGDFATRARATLSAGCDIALHCNGLMEEMKPVAEATPPLAGESAARAERALAHLAGKPMAQVDRAIEEARARFDALVAAA
ncbi:MULTISPECIES: beta-N-acetylhexosaminidase [unclassified Roseitalea]|uniref:beta-N-acetylhexosaminidase n=1 Tax=unclassified Roseitalea TaxID=2639107 RepID=UPI00273E8E5D|nr:MULTISPECIES: beta-N-acetylhexosaminidase [unclassified Roseitalea]